MSVRARPNVIAYKDAVVIEGRYERQALWHMPLSEAQAMSPAELRAEFRHAADRFDVNVRDLWAALKLVKGKAA